MPIELPPEIASTIPPDQLSHGSISRYNDLPSLIKGHIELDSYRGNSIGLPKAESKPEEIDKWATETSDRLKDKGFTISKLGDLPPADPKAYEFKFENVKPEDVANDEILNAFKPVAHAIGLSNAKAQQLVDWFAKDLMPSIMPEAKTRIEGQAVHELIDKTFPGMTEKTVEDYKRSVDLFKVTNPELPDLLNQDVDFGDGNRIALGDHPVMIKIISALAQVTNSDFGGNVSGNGIPSKEGKALADQATDIINNPGNPEHDLYVKGDAATHRKVREMFEKAYPGETTI